MPRGIKLIKNGTKKLKVIDLFAGAGLFSYAFAKEGFSLAGAVEKDAIAGATHKRNLGGNVIVDDICRIKPFETCDVLVGGPPCQGFSTLGKREKNDPRNSLSLEMIRWAKALSPKIVVIENVSAFVKSPIWRKLSRSFKRMGYSVSTYILNAYDFGAPQVRLRSFTIASQGGQPIIKPVLRKPVRTVGEAWKGLSSVPDGRNQHYAPKPSKLALERMKLIPEGGDKRDVLRLAPELAPPSWHRVRNEVTDVWGRLRFDRPSNTLRTCLLNPSKGRYIHPKQNRVISIREAARLHSIPDSWIFEGLPTQIARQIGNSVPPALGRAVARAVRKLL